MGSKKSKQPLARRDVPRGSVHGSTGPVAYHTERGVDSREASATETIATEAADTEAAARFEVQAEARRMDTSKEIAEIITTKPREFEARACTICVGIRPMGKNYSRVYCTRGRVRYCKCGFCGNTWAQQG